jgi:hypothetical protein
MSFPRHTKIYQSDEPEGGRTNGSTSLGDHRSDESSAGYSFVGCSPAEPASASPTATSLSQHPAAVNCSAAKRNLSPFLLSHLRGPLQSDPRDFFRLQNSENCVFSSFAIGIPVF